MLDSLMYPALPCKGDAGTQELILPDGAPQSIETLAKRYGAQVSFEGEPPLILRDGVLAAAYLCRSTVREQKSLAQLLNTTPAFSAVTASVPLSGGRARTMDRLSVRENGSLAGRRGIVCREDQGVVRIRPSATANALRVCAEANSMEAARALCEQFRRRSLELDAPSQ